MHSPQAHEHRRNHRDGPSVDSVQVDADAIAEDPSELHSEEVACGVPIRVMLADDHTLLREGLREILGVHGDIVVVGEASDGRNAVWLAEQLRPDVVLMDVGMRGLNGIEATRQIRARYTEVKVVGLSMHSRPRYVLDMLAAGASGYLLKVATSAEVCRAVRAVHQGKSYFCAQITRYVSLPMDIELAASRCRPLGAREREVVQLLAEGHSSASVARELHISLNTVESHRRNIMRKLDLHGVAELTRYAIREGLTPLDDE